ncbi:tetratricopeptide repeat protein [Foetidibacter luteolus]|uniref:tetratricopeptide repeat protein n=1 Tax=Foetidibacter luteolus TaxID=2608880 RepID=UPI00129A6DB3|nr:tetratricopeptide repeat protein [Foetidibacter luteolus]
MSLKKELKEASKLIDNLQIEEADKFLNELYSKHPDNNDIKILLAVTQNSLYNQDTALQLLDSILDSNPKHKHAIAMYPSVVLELADNFIENNDLTPLKQRLEKIEKMGFKKIGFDLGIVYNYLSIIHERNGDKRKAIDYLELQKELYKKDDFLNDFHVKSGDIDKKIEMLTQYKNS